MIAATNTNARADHRFQFHRTHYRRLFDRIVERILPRTDRTLTIVELQTYGLRTAWAFDCKHDHNKKISQIKGIRTRGVKPNRGPQSPHRDLRTHTSNNQQQRFPQHSS
jgi:hypothetical protein